MCLYRLVLACLALFVHAMGSTGPFWRPCHSRFSWSGQEKSAFFSWCCRRVWGGYHIALRLFINNHWPLSGRPFVDPPLVTVIHIWKVYHLSIDVRVILLIYFLVRWNVNLILSRVYVLQVCQEPPVMVKQLKTLYNILWWMSGSFYPTSWLNQMENQQVMLWCWWHKPINIKW